MRERAGEGGPQGRKREETARFRGTHRDPVGSGGLSLVSQVAPVRLAAVMMGIWFAANAIANYLAGILESLLAGSTIPLYWFLVGSSLGAGVLLLLITPLLKYLMHGKG